MDVTCQFDEYVRNVSRNNLRRKEGSMSPFVLKTNDLYQKIKAKELWLQCYYDGFIGFHKNFKPSVLQSFAATSNHSKNVEDLRSLTADERNKISTEFLVFYADITTEINDLNRVIKIMSTTSENKHHLSIIVSILLDKIYALSKYFQNMQNENSKYNKNPFKLLTLFRTELDKAQMQQFHNPIITPLPTKIIEKYNSNISVQNNSIQKYNEVSSVLKQKLMATKKSLKTKFSEDLEIAFDTENTVMKVSNLMNEFVNMLKIQSEQIQDVNTDAEIVKDHVEDADRELILTIQRSKSYQRNMIILVLGLSFLLLFLDWLG